MAGGTLHPATAQLLPLLDLPPLPQWQQLHRLPPPPPLPPPPLSRPLLLSDRDPGIDLFYIF